MQWLFVVLTVLVVHDNLAVKAASDGTNTMLSMIPFQSVIVLGKKEYLW